jgi:hypothetical protein
VSTLIEPQGRGSLRLCANFGEYPFQLDFSHLGAERMGVFVARRPKGGELEASSRREHPAAPLPWQGCSTGSPKNGPLSEACTTSSSVQGPAPFGQRVLLCASSLCTLRRHCALLLEDLRLFAGRWCRRATRKKSQEHLWIPWLMRLPFTQMAKVELYVIG